MTKRETRALIMATEPEVYLAIAELAARSEVKPKTIRRKMAACTCWLTTDLFAYISDIEQNDGERTEIDSGKTRIHAKAPCGHDRDSSKQPCQTRTRRAGNFRACGEARPADCGGCQC
jgi:hypothetical protein